MAKVLVQHDISGQVVELDEIQLAHPVLGPHYKRVRVNANGKVYAWNAKDPDADEDTEVKAVVTDSGIQEAVPESTKAEAKAADKKARS
jgi:hypothetical protein